MVWGVWPDGYARLVVSGNSSFAQQGAPALKRDLQPDLKKTQKPLLSSRFVKALGYAAKLHGRQIRKRTGRPYIGHLLSVTATVIEYGGDEEMAIAALLHDAVEDQGGAPRSREIRKKF